MSVSAWLLDQAEPSQLQGIPTPAEDQDPGELPASQVPASAGGEEIDHASLLIADPGKLDLHLSYSDGMERGPIIHRNGMSSPIMEDPDEPGSYTTDPDFQRIGSYFILREKKDEVLRDTALLVAGSYILLGKLIGSEQAKQEALRILLRYVRDVPPFPPPPELRPAVLAPDISRLLSGPQGLFAHRLESVHLLFSQTADLSDQANEAMHKEYGIKYSDYLSNVTPEFRHAVHLSLRKHLRLLALLSQTECHDEAAISKGLGSIEMMQGCGDLTMNEWNVAFSAWPSHPKESEWTLLHPPDEPLHDRTYSCLIKWACERSNSHLQEIAAKGVRIVYPYQIATVQFHGPSSTQQGKRPNRHVLLHGFPIGHLIEFAVCGRRVCRNGRVTRLANIVREFTDARHIFKMPNLNPDLRIDEDLEAGLKEAYRSRPRNLYNESTRNDVWLGEAALIQGDRNLRVAALEHAIQLNVKELGAPRDWIDTILRRGRQRGFETVGPADEITRAGQWRWVPEGRENWLEIFFPRSQYPCSMIGTQAEDEHPGVPKPGMVETKKLFFFAHGHTYGQNGCTIPQAARYLRSEGAWDALVFDEGQDVFQLLRDDATKKLMPRVPLKRKQLRCVFWGHEKRSGTAFRV